MASTPIFPAQSSLLRSSKIQEYICIPNTATVPCRTHKSQPLTPFTPRRSHPSRVLASASQGEAQPASAPLPHAGDPIPTRLNNIPHQRETRQHFYREVTAAVTAAVASGAKRLSVRCTIPELNTEFDVYRVGTLLEMVREMAGALASDGKTVKVRHVPVKAPRRFPLVAAPATTTFPPNLILKGGTREKSKPPPTPLIPLLHFDHFPWCQSHLPGWPLLSSPLFLPMHPGSIAGVRSTGAGSGSVPRHPALPLWRHAHHGSNAMGGCLRVHPAWQPGRQ